MGAGATGAVYRFDRFALYPDRGVLLSAEGQEIALRPKAFTLLHLLVENAGRLLSRDTIMRVVWPDVIIADDGITQCIRDIRQALADDTQRILRTVRQRGYILAAEVVVTLVQSNVITQTLQLADKPSIAVLPFRNLSADPEQEFFSDGIADDVITELSRSRALFVIARNSSFVYRGQLADVKQVARELGVRYVVEGSVRRDVGRVRINAQLIEAETGNHLWAERYDREIEHMFAVQDEITLAVISAIQPAVADAEFRRTLRRPPEDLGTWEAYQRGLWHLSRASPTDSILAREFFQRAMALDAMFAPPCAAMAMLYMQEGLSFATHSWPEALKLAGGWAHKAVDIDASDADAQAILAWTAAISDGPSQESWDGVSLALALNPNSSWANAVKGALLLFSCQPSQARNALSTALRLDPRGPISVLPVTQIAVSYYFEHDYPQAAEWARRAVSRYPESPLAYKWMAAALGQLGRIDEAAEMLQRTINLSPSSFDLYVRNCPPWVRPEDHQHMLDGLRKSGWQG
ncbi:MAG: winged helix-turn-helix domain-containing protein [Acetobacteraceae bacterium]|jgi:adenylate cyclase